MHPILSVVIPICNTEPYLEKCLISVAEQTYTALDVVLVDDGSTDNSADIAQRFVSADGRFRLVHAEGTAPGAGAARNIGIRHIAPDAKYLAFADSDDVLPESAYLRLVESLEETGSEIATGNVFRLDAQGTFPFGKLADVFKLNRKRTNIREAPSLVVDRVVWNKAYRRSFWDHHGLHFPEGIVYDDSPITIPLYYLADSVDILAETVYYWRIRDHGLPQITQQRTVSAMLDRFTSMEIIRTLLESDARFSAESRISYDRNVLSEELPLFFDELVEADCSHRTAFVENAARLLAEIDADLMAELPKGLLRQYAAITEGRTRDFIESLSRGSSEGLSTVHALSESTETDQLDS
jgi:CDP-glycerol glycerophosphotransferase